MKTYIFQQGKVKLFCYSVSFGPSGVLFLRLLILRRQSICFLIRIYIYLWKLKIMANLEDDEF